MRIRSLLVVAAILAAVSPPAAADAQFRGGGRFNAACQFSWDNENYFVSPFFRGNPRYDGRVVFARIKYRGSYECGGEGPGWSHDYPRTEYHFTRILKEITTTNPFVDAGPIMGSALV